MLCLLQRSVLKSSCAFHTCLCSPALCINQLRFVSFQLPLFSTRSSQPVLVSTGILFVHVSVFPILFCLRFLSLQKNHLQRPSPFPIPIAKPGKKSCNGSTSRRYMKRELWTMCWEVTGKAPITLNWIDRNKGDSLHPNFRSRLVVREVKKQHGALPSHMLFSNMPPLEAAKILCSLLASKRTSRSGKLLKLALYDPSRAHFYGESQRAVYVSLPEGDEAENMCALLHKTMYGTQDASHAGKSTILESSSRKGSCKDKHGLQCSDIRNEMSCCWYTETISWRRRTEVSEGYVVRTLRLSLWWLYWTRRQPAHDVAESNCDISQRWIHQFRSRPKTCRNDHKTVGTRRFQRNFYTRRKEEIERCGSKWTTTHECGKDYVIQIVGDESTVSGTRQSRHRWIGEVAHQKNEESDGSGFQGSEKTWKVSDR